MTLRETPSSGSRTLDLPRRWKPPRLISFFIFAALVFFFFRGANQANITWERIIDSGPRLFDFLSQAIPPDWPVVGRVFDAMILTLEMALVGTVLGVILSLPAALLAAKNTTPHPVVAFVMRLIITTFRAIPELVWALIFIVAVGLGPFAGILAIAVDVLGFAGKFFAERIEEVGKGPAEAIKSSGAGPITTIFTAIIPQCLPSFVGTSLYTFEKSVRSAVVLGLVGVGGIGVEFDNAMTFFRYDEAMAILLLILITLIIIERVSIWIRSKFID